MTVDELASAVLAMVRERDYVSFAELAREWPEHFRDGFCELRAAQSAPVTAESLKV